MADDSLIGKWQFKGKVYELHQSDLTTLRLRLFKQWFGDAYGSFAGFISLVLQTDVDAMACALWMMQTDADEKPKEPREMDFSMADFETIKTPRKKANPTPADTPTSGSAKTSTSSEPSTSSD